MNIAISTRVVQAQGYDEPRDALSHDWQAWCAHHAILPILVPNNLRDPGAYLRSLSVDALILSGGNDAVQRNGSNFSALRNNTEFSLLSWAESARIPVLGVCRGMHIINLYFGGSVVGEIGREHINTTHAVQILSPLVEYVGPDRTFTVNSYHSQGINRVGLAPSLSPAALSDEGLIEALVHPTLPIMGIQWHPERPSASPELDQAVVKELFGIEDTRHV